MLNTMRQPLAPLLRAALLSASLLTVVLPLLTACSQDRDSQANAKPPARKMAVTAAPPQARDIAVTERSVGLLESLVIPEIAAEVEGRVVDGYAKTGERVTQGQLLAELEVEDYRIASEATRAELGRLEVLASNQRQTVERYTKLAANKLISTDRYDEAIAQLHALDAQVRAARARQQQSERELTKTRVLSPYDGVVDAELISPGDFVKVGDPLFRVATVDRLRARLPLPEMLASKIVVGQAVELWSPVAPDVRVTSTISELRPTIGVGNRAIDVFAIFDNPGPWQPGASVTGEIVVERRAAALLVPEGAVVMRPAGTVVYVVENETARQRVVEVGIYQDGLVEIRSGLNASDRVIDSGAGFLSDGTAVSVAAPEAR
ncbi:MAG TPA: efflux RND transporter periplasmic adaptor subunit [Porticoccaceae bacterium]|nr:efflux RND transporter periplasmic adaptor subunit [Porticoccaceae bacterium]